MQSPEQLSARGAEEGTGSCTVEEGGWLAEKDDNDLKGVGAVSGPQDGGSVPLPPPPPHPTRNATRKRALSGLGSFLHPLPNIETIMTYPRSSLARPTYNSIVKGEPPAQVYSTVIHTPRPLDLRPRYSPTTSALDHMLMRAAELRTGAGKRANSRLRVEVDDVDGSIEDGKGTGDEALEMERPPSPSPSTTSTSCATIASSPPTSPPSSPFPSPAPSPSLDAITTDFDPPSPAASFRTSYSSLSSLYASYSTPTSLSGTLSTHSSASNPNSSSASSAYPSPPPSPLPPPSHQPQNQPQQDPRRQGEAKSHRQSQSLPSLPLIDALPDTLFDSSSDEDDAMDWRPNGAGGGVVLGAAGIAMSPRALRSSKIRCSRCKCSGLGLYVIEEEDSEFSHFEGVEL